MKELYLVCFALNLFIAVLVGALMLVLPILTRKSFLFGVRIPAEHQGCPEARAIKKNYATICLAGSFVLIALIVAQYVLFPEWTLTSIMYFPLLFATLQAAAYIPNWKKAAKLKEERGWKVPALVFADTKSSHSRGNLRELPWGWYISSFLLIVAGVVVALIVYPGLPEQIPIHFDANMQPDGWADKSILAVMMMPLVNLATTFVLWLSGLMFVRAKLQIDQHNPELSFTQHRLYRRRMGHGMGILTLGLCAMMVVIGFMTIIPELYLYIPFWALVALPCLTPVPLVAIMIRSGQGGCKIKPKETIRQTSGAQNGADAPGAFPGRGDDRYWALGMFYHNPDDPAYIVEDRFGNNIGFNYSRLPVKIGVILLALGVVALYVWLSFVLFPALSL